MINLLKTLYQFKIRLMFFFNLGWGEFATPIAVIRDIAIILTFAKLVFNIGFGWLIDIVICVVCFSLFYFIGRILVANHMIQFANKLSNRYNPELSLINKIAEKLGVK